MPNYSLAMKHRLTYLVGSLYALFGAWGASQAEDEPRALIPAESLLAPEGMEVTVWATSPLLHNPTNMDIDHLGRI